MTPPCEVIPKHNNFHLGSHLFPNHWVVILYMLPHTYGWIKPDLRSHPISCLIMITHLSPLEELIRPLIPLSPGQN